MKRAWYFNFIEEKINFLSFRIKERGKINLLDLNIYSETFFAELMNLIFGYNLQNENQYTQNVEGIDLIDNTNKIIVQVSSICTKAKIENSLSKNILSNYKDYNFKFIAIAGEVNKFKNQTFCNPHSVNFNSNNDLYDISTLLKIILNFDIDKQIKLFEFIKKELGNDIDLVKTDSNLATIVNILSQENLLDNKTKPEMNSFEIFQKITHNKLEELSSFIYDYFMFYSKLNEKYDEYNKQGKNNSLSILLKLNSIYCKLKNPEQNSKYLFFQIIDEVIKIIQQSKNYIKISDEELNMCVSIIVVDAFIKCKIFENPLGYNHVIA